VSKQLADGGLPCEGLHKRQTTNCQLGDASVFIACSLRGFPMFSARFVVRQIGSFKTDLHWHGRAHVGPLPRCDATVFDTSHTCCHVLSLPCSI